MIIKTTIPPRNSNENRCGTLTGSKGFTLVELLISVAVISILAGMAAQTFNTVLSSRDIALRRIEMNETARAALEFISSELNTAYLTPDSVKPIESNVNTNLISDRPRFRFAGINRDIDVTRNDEYEIPGIGIDDDGDGLVDEEILDGVDGDYPNNFNSSARPDPLGCEEGDRACIDEDIGMFPSDLLHFVSAVENEDSVVLQEISYGLDTTGTRLMRRAEVLDITTTNNVDQLVTSFGQFIDINSGKRLLPNPVPPGQVVSRSQLRTAINNWDLATETGSLTGDQNIRSNDVNRTFQVLAYDIRGLRLRYWYYDYNRGGWRVTKEWDSTQETALLPPSSTIFNELARNNSIEGRSRASFANLIVNEVEDIYPKLPGLNRFAVTSPGSLLRSPEWSGALQRITQRTDGLPNLVEITIYVEDRKREINPIPYTSRVFIPNNYISLGI